MHNKIKLEISAVTEEYFVLKKIFSPIYENKK